MKKILITPRSFAKYNKEEVIELFKKHAIKPFFNEIGTIYDEEKLKKSMVDMDGVIVGIDPVTADVLQHAQKLRAISKYGVGIDNIDTKICDQKSIKVSRTVGANSEAVADFNFALLTATARRLVEIHNSAKQENDWSKKISLDIFNKKIGVIGLGAIGKGTVKRAQGFNMIIYGYDIYEDREYIKKNKINFTNLETIFEECDFVCLHLPLTEMTFHLVDEELLKRAKNTLVIINTARGELINENDLYNALKEKMIYGAGVDTFEEEPATHSKLLELDNIIVGTHTAASTVGAIKKMTLMAVENILKDLN